MATTASRTSPLKKQQKPQETSESIQEQTQAYLESGGKIDMIANGVSGREYLKSSKHITLGSKSQDKSN